MFNFIVFDRNMTLYLFGQHPSFGYPFSVIIEMKESIDIIEHTTGVICVVKH